MDSKLSLLQEERYKYEPKLPKNISGNLNEIKAEIGAATTAISDATDLKQIFKLTFGKPVVTFQPGNGDLKKDPLKVGVILSGGQAPGGHNVISGFFDGIKKINSDSKLFGFLGGPSGLINNQKMEITEEYLKDFRNTGGFDIIGSGRTKIETDEQFAKSAAVAKELELDAVVIIGGDDSNTNAALLAEYFLANNLKTQVIGNEQIETSFGFDTACKTYSELIGNISRDANSAKKYWHFIKLMGRSASHIALECALQTHPNICLIGEEIESKKETLNDIVNYITKIVYNRSKAGKNFGVVLVPEGADYFKTLNGFTEQTEYINPKLSKDSSYTFSSLPVDIQKQLIMDRDPHGNVQVSKIETEKLLIEMVENKLHEMKVEDHHNVPFSYQNHFFGYEGRCAAPSNFDADYTYSLGYTGALLINIGLTGYMATISNLTAGIVDSTAGGIPITMMMNLERRHGKDKPVIKKALTELDGAPFKAFAAKREDWAMEDSYNFPGPIQYFGPASVCDQPTKTLILEQEGK